MIEIIPTILTSDLSEYNAQLAQFTEFTKRIQLDIVDGDFASVRTVSLADIGPFPEGVKIDLHMMVSQPSKHLARIIELKPHLCIFHAEVNEKLLPIFEELKKHNIKTGLAFLQGTYPPKLSSLLKVVDHALIFAGHIGRQGGSADLLQTEKVHLIREIAMGIEIGWDGGANLDNIRTLSTTGINVVNVGMAISRAADPAAAYNELNLEAEHRGVRF